MDYPATVKGLGMHQHFRIAIIRSEIVCFSIKNVKPFILIIHCQWQILIKCSILIMICYTQQKQLVFPMSQKPCCGVFPYNAPTESVPKRLVGECSHKPSRTSLQYLCLSVAQLSPAFHRYQYACWYQQKPIPSVAQLSLAFH